jgi:hypothetical protein
LCGLTRMTGLIADAPSGMHCINRPRSF